MIQNKTIILSYRIILALLGILAIGLNHFSALTEKGYSILDTLASYRFFTLQSNVLVVVWLLLAIYYNSQDEKLNMISGSFKGAVVSYITVTFIIFALLLAGTNVLVGIDIYTNILFHYIIPIMFIIDFIVFKHPELEWKYIPIWYIYPLLYIGFAVTYGFFVTNGIFGLPPSPYSQSDYIYPFFNLDILGLPGLILVVIGLSIFYLILAMMYVGISKLKP